MSQLIDAGVAEERPRDFIIEFTDNGVTTVADLTGLKVYLFKWKDGHGLDSGVNINTVDNPTELVITDAAGGGIQLRPLNSWWDDDGKFEMVFGVDDAIFFWAPDTDVLKITVVKRPTKP